ncbi:serine dehydratase-like protein, isoform CRA_a [Catenaria anguillulae PL171]|uniref:L-serine ammonia-lyase n=1 Tax=Catenaria anguillulae PL171 TaxID=765915 RepID=A0A1Y2HT60_9FUNG|nr:serine dehydratase-like protein, isoform CRA_a [Catenaria anguillulae PL171]
MTAQPLHVFTPLVRSPTTSRVRSGNAGLRLWYKLENLQSSGSFKDRGILHLCQTHHARLSALGIVPHFISSSGGNAGLAAAYAAYRLNCPVTVFVPNSTPAFIRTKLAATGATVVVHGDVWADANAKAQEYLTELGDKGVFVHPFEDELIWTGHASLVHEIDQQCGDRVPSVLVCSVGGGGLLSGVCQGIEEVADKHVREGKAERADKWMQVKVLAVETVGADCLAQSVAKGELVTLPGITSIAKSLGASRPAQRAFEYAVSKAFPKVQTLVVTDKEAVQACREFADDMRFLVEPACGAALAGTWQYIRSMVDGSQVEKDVDIVTVVCGGSVIKLDMLSTPLAN